MQLRIFKKKLCVWKNPRTWTCKRGKYLEIATDDSVITCDEIKDATKTISINFCLIKHRSKQKKVLLFPDNSDSLKGIDIKNII